jgi:hypothetical protein
VLGAAVVLALGVRHVATLAGVELLGLLDALRENPDLTLGVGRRETAVVRR